MIDSESSVLLPEEASVKSLASFSGRDRNTCFLKIPSQHGAASVWASFNWEDYSGVSQEQEAVEAKWCCEVHGSILTGLIAFSVLETQNRTKRTDPKKGHCESNDWNCKACSLQKYLPLKP